MSKESKELEASTTASTGAGANKSRVGATGNGKAEIMLPVVRDEYNAHIESLQNGTLDLAELSSDVTSWGKRRGRLNGAGLAEAAD